ncbi:hypothetical protein BESB_064800 [Besnoitia besnoiti]|uniref:Toxoplasma gondii family A protein n=1 Tax=Besnoitia besnoiti TaxID=94643 RepID=A0A2A9M976_BESBE|nr:hypothetical protein BESB_064800 [Besnoitia besnoiti]PFH34449.1 hypothetical protein BESB_064800 [Besnoitia besnoiti]
MANSGIACSLGCFPQRSMLALVVLLAFSSSCTIVFSESVSPEDSTPPADYLHIIEKEGIKTSQKQEVWLQAAQSFALVDKTDEGLEIKPTSWTTTGYAYVDSECKLDKTVTMGSLFPKASGDRWSTTGPLEKKTAGVKHIYKFVTPPADQLDGEFVSFCLVVQDKIAPKVLGEPSTEATKPGLTLIIHASATRATVGLAMASVLSSLWFLSA